MATKRVLIVFAILGFLAVCKAAEKGFGLDAVDIDAVFRNDRLLKNYVDCLLEKRPCSKEGAELKKRLPNVLNNNCSGCTTSQRERGVKAIRLLAANRPDLWRPVKAKYDPTGQRSIEFNKRYHLSV